MTEEQKLQEFVNSYTDANGDNPISAAFSLWTIAKTTPIQLIKAGLVGWFFVAVTFLLAWSLAVPWIYLLIIQIVAGIGFFFITFFAALKFMSSFVVNAIAELLSGILSPIDDMYEVYANSTHENLSRYQFTKKVLKEVVFPRVSDILKFVPMKKSITKTLSIFADKVSTENSDISYEEIKDSNIKSMMVKINQAATTTKNIVGKPFYISAIMYAILWTVIVVGFFVGWY